MRFQNVNLFFPLPFPVALTLAVIFKCGIKLASSSSLLSQTQSHSHSHTSLNNSVFEFHDVTQCSRREFYDLDNFACVACSREQQADDDHLQPTADKFSCKCSLNSITIAFYDTAKERPICADICRSIYTEVPNSAETNGDSACQPVVGTNVECIFKYVNFTASNLKSIVAKSANSNAKRIRISPIANDGNCSACDLNYNFRYQDFCIANALLKPYLHYNAFWQTPSVSGRFGDLKFVAFFCLTMRNATACNHLANLCVQSHFSVDKNSPCSAFLLAQASDVHIRYSSLEDQQQAIRPNLFYKRGKETAKLLTQSVGSAYKLSSNSRQRNDRHNRLEFFSAVYAIEGTLQRWGLLKRSHVNLCRLHSVDNNGGDLKQEIRFAQQNEFEECAMTLENLIDLAKIYANNQFMSLFLNFTKDGSADKVYLQAVPILIENLNQDNQRNQPEEWQLVKRFQLIETQPRHQFGARKPIYEDAHKLQLYRSIRYVENFEFHYEIEAKNHIRIPIVRLRYRNIKLNANTTLDQIHHFKFQITFERVSERTTQRLNEVALPLLLLVAVGVAVLRVYNYRKRRAATVLVDSCDMSCFTEFLLQLFSNMANALLAGYVLHVISTSLPFLTQRTVEITLPLSKNHDGSFEIIIYAALVLKFIFLGVHFWRISHVDLFFIDWERPKSYDNNHFNLKSNLETSSVCSSVRTFVSENNVSAWRIFFTANEWIRLSGKQKTSFMLQGFSVLIMFKLLDKDNVTQRDHTLKTFIILVVFVAIYITQLLCRILLVNRILGHPLQKFIDLCSLANISVFTLLERSYGYYIHGRSPHGFADTDMSSMIMQLQRESQNMCGRRGLLSDSDQQTYIIMPPINLRTYFEKLLVPFQRSCSISQAHFQKETNSGEGNWEKTSIAYSSVNRFFCAFIDHAIKDMDYIIKERSFLEKLFSCEFDNYLTENKGTFYIDNANTFGQLSLYDNALHILVLELLLLLSIYSLTANLTAAVVVVCLLNKCIFRNWVRQNISTKTLIDKRFLM